MELKSYSAAAFVFVCQITLSATVSSSASTKQEQEDYLLRFAYMGNLSSDPRLGDITDPNEMFSMAVMKFQMMAGLNATGTVDAETQKMMEMPRCGVPDEVGMGMVAKRRKRRYAAQGSRWPKTSLTYRINNFTPDLPQDRVISDIQTAFKRWSDASPLRFSQVTSTSPKVDIDINFVSGNHGDGSAFDGPGKTLAHAFFPQFGGAAHFDEDELWTSESSSGTNLLQVAIHEFGHSLGLSHSEERDSIMAPFYRAYVPNVQLHSDDIQGINYIYRSRRASTTRRPDIPGTRASTTKRSPTPDVDICRNTTVDAIFAVGSELYLFRGSQYYKLDRRGIMAGYPKPIRVDWPGLPDDIDTAFYSAGDIFFFKGGLVWSYNANSRRLQSSSPQNISARFHRVPSNLDAAFIWSGNGRLYFIKGDQYYRVSHYSSSPYSRLDPYYPSKLKYWKGLPNKIDAAFNFSNGRTYFFSGNNFYRFNDFEFRVDAGYPRPSSSWLNCREGISDESHPDMMEREWEEGEDQFMGALDSSSSSSPDSLHLAPVWLLITFAVLSKKFPLCSV